MATPLDPLEDLVSWISGLSSKSYTEDLLFEKHGLAGTGETRKAAAAIGVFARSAVGLLDQAFSAAPHLAFLPLYYAVLNLSKIYVAAAGGLTQLQSNRQHGASYNPNRKRSHDLLTEQIVLKRNGQFSLFYQNLAGGEKVRHDKVVTLRELVPFLWNVGFEYQQAYGAESPFQDLSVRVEEENSRFRLKINLHPPLHPLSRNLRALRFATGCRRSDEQTLHSPAISAATVEEATAVLSKKHLRPQLLRESRFERMLGSVYCSTPLSTKHLLMIEEIPIWLTFFALANIVRYNPEFLEKLRDSKAWPLILAMRKHETLRFLILTWSNLHKRVFYVAPVIA